MQLRCAVQYQGPCTNSNIHMRHDAARNVQIHEQAHAKLCRDICYFASTQDTAHSVACLQICLDNHMLNVCKVGTHTHTHVETSHIAASLVETALTSVWNLAQLMGLRSWTCHLHHSFPHWLHHWPHDEETTALSVCHQFVLNEPPHPSASSAWG